MKKSQPVAFLKSYIGKTIITTVMTIVGVSVGIYVGYALAGKDVINNDSIADHPVRKIAPDMNLSFLEGDPFPLETYLTLDSTEGSFDEILKEKRTILLFVSVGCLPCNLLLDKWQEVREHLLPDVQDVICLSNRNLENLDSYKQYLSDRAVVMIDTDRFHQYYNINLYPTMIGVDQYGIVLHIQYGYTGYIDPEILEEFTDVKM